MNKPTKILIHLTFWIAFTLIPMGLVGDMNMDYTRPLWHSLIRTLSFAVFFYLNYLLFVDRFYFNKKKTAFVLVNLTVVVVVMLLKTVVDIDLPDGKQTGMQKHRPDNFMFFMDFLLYLIPIAIAVVIKTTGRLSDFQIKQAEDERNLLQHELQYLKYQLQPHFFFNSLNTIYSLIDLDADKAKATVHDLGKLMRYLLYRTDVEKVELSQEVEFIEQYINLMKLRMRKNTNIVVNFPDKVPQLSIAPLLIIPIVENAFKHGVSATQDSELIFTLEIDGSRIIFKGENTNFAKTDDDKSGSGIGIENLRKRLNLLYAGRFRYENEIREDRYYCELEIG